MKYFFIGIDVSKEKLDATLIHYESESDSEQQLAYTTVENNPKGFRSLVSWSKKNAGRGVKTDAMLFCCETTGGYDRALCDWLYGNGLKFGARALCRSSVAWVCAKARTIKPTRR